MGKGISITTIGLSKVLRKLNTFPAALRKEIDAELSLASLEVRREAVKNAPADEAGLKLSIQQGKSGDNYEVIVGKAYAPFVEFGTKKRYKPTPGFENYASQFRGRRIGPGGGSLDEAILGWVKRKRIRFEKAGRQSIVGARPSRSRSLQTRFLTDEQTAFIIARHIAFHGVRPHPFLFPAFVKVRRGLNTNITNAIRRAFQK